MVSPTLPLLAQQALLQRENDVGDDEPISPTTIARSTCSRVSAKPDGKKCHRSKLLYKLGFENAATFPTIVPSSREPSRGSLLGQVQTRTEPLKYDDNFDKMMLEKKERALQRAANSNVSVFSAFGALFPQLQEAEASAKTVTADSERDDVESFKPSSAASTDCSASACTADDQSISSSEGSKKVRRRGGLTFNDQVTVVPIPKRDEYSKRIRDRLWMNAQELQSQVARNTMEFASEGWDWKNVYEDESMYVCAVSGEKVHPVHCEMEED